MKFIILGCCIIATGWKLKKDLELGPNLQNQNKKEFEMFAVSYTNISSSFILILNSNSRDKKCISYYALMFTITSQIWQLADLWKTQKSKYLENKTQFFPLVKKIHEQGCIMTKSIVELTLRI